MRQKLHTPPIVQDLVNLAMSWAQKGLREEGRIAAAMAMAPSSGDQPTLRPSRDASRPLADQESGLIHEANLAWQDGALAAVALIAPVFYGKSGSGERATAVRLHIEAPGYRADILMPYRIRPASRWRGKAQNRVHFSHPVAQEAESWLSDSPSTRPQEGSRG